LWSLQGSEVAGTWYEDCGKGVGEKSTNIDKIGLDAFGFMPRKRTTDALFILRRMQGKYHDKKRKLFFVLWIWRRHLKES